MAQASYGLEKWMWGPQPRLLLRLLGRLVVPWPCWMVAWRLPERARTAWSQTLPDLRTLKREAGEGCEAFDMVGSFGLQASAPIQCKMGEAVGQGKQARQAVILEL